MSYSIMLNGKLRGRFNGLRDLRQGILYHFFLFTLVVDGLGRWMEVAKVKGLFNGFLIGREKVEVSHL